jgi:serine/threonine protein kinase
LIFRKSPITRYVLLTQRFEKDFTDLGMLGAGGFAEVHRVEHKNDGRLYAVKIIKVKPSRSEEEAA